MVQMLYDLTDVTGKQRKLRIKLRPVLARQPPLPLPLPLSAPAHDCCEQAKAAAAQVEAALERA